MGACDVAFTMPGKATIKEINDKLKDVRESEREQNGHQDGYSGDFQTIPGIDFHLDKVFASYNEAYEYCLSNSKKWENAIAVYYHTGVKVEPTAKEKRIDARIVKLKTQEKALYEFSKKEGFVRCKRCSSRLALAFIRFKNCRVCDGSLLTGAERKKSDRLKAEIERLMVLLSEEKQKAKEKALSKLKFPSIKTLVAGWAAC